MHSYTFTLYHLLQIGKYLHTRERETDRKRRAMGSPVSSHGMAMVVFHIVIAVVMVSTGTINTLAAK